jgi:hypothetical protein
MVRKMKRKIAWLKILKKSLNILLILIIFSLLYSLGVAVTENILVNREVEDFKSRAVFEYEEEIVYASGVYQTRRYYKVSRETSYELADTRPVFTDITRRLIGQKG